MRWKKKPVVIPEWKNSRVVRKFAWWPVDMYDDYTVWLETYLSHERYFEKGDVISTNGRTSLIAGCTGWQEVDRVAQLKT